MRRRLGNGAANAHDVAPYSLMAPPMPSERWHKTAVAVVRAAALLLITSAALSDADVVGRNRTASEPWRIALTLAGDTLAEGNVEAAAELTFDALIAALSGGGWNGMLAVGSSYLRIAAASQQRAAYEAKAQHAFAEALRRAHGAGSLDGVLATAAAAIDLRERTFIEETMALADRMTVDGRSLRRVDAVRAWLAEIWSTRDRLEFSRSRAQGYD